ncbi:hypothetical protein PIB30_103456, partial [Stylosanthes scabra]|nr:hypothetical protein [Stylosanthes scabra]
MAIGVRCSAFEVQREYQDISEIARRGLGRVCNSSVRDEGNTAREEDATNIVGVWFTVVSASHSTLGLKRKLSMVMHYWRPWMSSVAKDKPKSINMKSEPKFTT